MAELLCSDVCKVEVAEPSGPAWVGEGVNIYPYLVMLFLSTSLFLFLVGVYHKDVYMYVFIISFFWMQGWGYLKSGIQVPKTIG